MSRWIITVQNVIIISFSICLLIGGGIIISKTFFPSPAMVAIHADHARDIIITDTDFDFSLFHGSGSSHSGSILLRRSIMELLIAQRFDSFAVQPFDATQANGLLSPDSSLSGGYTMGAIDTEDDMLDIFIGSWLEQAERSGSLEFVIPYTIRKEWSDIFLFRSGEDLRALGYIIVSHRERDTDDVVYRQHNVWQTFFQIGHIRVMNPGGSLSFLDDSNFDYKGGRTLYRNGYAIVGDDIVSVYGGGMCGGSTAVYQGVVTNTALSIDGRSHSKRYASLYTAKINGEVINTPGLDRTIFAPYLDLTLTNQASYPQIVILNFIDGKEEVFTLARPEHQGSVSFVSSFVNKFYQRCYTWSINDVLETSCYNTVQ